MIAKLHCNKKGGILSNGKLSMIRKDKLYDYATFLLKIIIQKEKEKLRNICIYNGKRSYYSFGIFFFTFSALSFSFAFVPFSSSFFFYVRT